MERPRSVLENMGQWFCNDASRPIDWLIDRFEVYYMEKCLSEWVFEGTTQH